MTMWEAGTARPSIANMYYSRQNAPRSNTAIVPVSADGRFSVYNDAGSTSVTVDVQGYFTTATGQGGFTPFTPTRIANSAGWAHGSNIPQQRLASGSVLDIQVGGVAEIPADATAVFANIEARNATKLGQLKVGQGGSAMGSGYAAAMDYGTSGPYDSGMTIKLDSHGRMRVMNYNGSPIDLKIDIQGYFSDGAASNFHPLAPANSYSTGTADRTKWLQPGELREVPVAGTAGIPNGGQAVAGAFTVTVKGWEAGGTVTLFDADEVEVPPATTSSFVAGQGDPGNGITSTAMTEISVEGTVALHNTSSRPVAITITAQGWFSDPAPDVEVDPAMEEGFSLVEEIPDESMDSQEEIDAWLAAQGIGAASHAEGGGVVVYGAVKCIGAIITAVVSNVFVITKLKKVKAAIKAVGGAKAAYKMLRKYYKKGRKKRMSRTEASSYAFEKTFDRRGVAEEAWTTLVYVGSLGGVVETCF